MEWQHSGSLRPKNFRGQKSAGKFLSLIFSDQYGILFINYLWKGRTINAVWYSSMLVKLNDILKENAVGKSPRIRSLAQQCSCSPDTCNPKEAGPPGLPVSWSPTLFFSESGPVRLPTVPWTEKQNNWKFAIFHPIWKSSLPRRHDWTDSILNFFSSGLQNLEQRTMKCIELRVECVE